MTIAFKKGLLQFLHCYKSIRNKGLKNLTYPLHVVYLNSRETKEIKMRNYRSALVFGTIVTIVVVKILSEIVSLVNSAGM
jgi:hypothetical protein